MILGITGVIFAAIGMCMCLLPEWNSFRPGVVMGCIIGSLILGVGMCLVMVWSNLVPGIILGLVGIVLLLMLIPLMKGIK